MRLERALAVDKQYISALSLHCAFPTSFLPTEQHDVIMHAAQAAVQLLPVLHPFPSDECTVQRQHAQTYMKEDYSDYVSRVGQESGTRGLKVLVTFTQ